MAAPNGGLITETNAQYYTGSDIFLGITTNVNTLTVTLDTDLHDAVNSIANYNVLVDPTGSGLDNNYLLYAPTVNGALNGATLLAYPADGFWVGPAGAVPGLYTVSPTGGSGIGLIVTIEIDLGGAAIINSVISAGSGYQVGDVLTIGANELGIGSAATTSIPLTLGDLYSGSNYTRSCCT